MIRRFQQRTNIKDGKLTLHVPERPYEIVSPNDVAQKLLLNYNIAIVDVRDVDYQGGHVIGCIHFPSSKFTTDSKETVQSLVEQCANKDEIVLYCMYGQQRSHHAAIDIANVMSEMTMMNLEHLPKISVMSKGFQAFLQSFKGRDDLIEDYDESYWITMEDGMQVHRDDLGLQFLPSSAE